MKEIKNALVISHTDLDGVSAGFLMETAIKCQFKNADTTHKFVNYNEINDTVALAVAENDYDLITITDMSVDKETAELLNETVNKIILIDHHSTATWLNKYDWATVQTHRQSGFDAPVMACATSLVYNRFKDILDEYCRGIKGLVNLVELWDTWAWKTDSYGDKARNLNIVFNCLGIEGFLEWLREDNENIREVYDLDDLYFTEGIIKQYNKTLDMFFNSALNSVKTKNMTINSKEYNVGIFFTSMYTSEVCNKVLEDKGYDFVIAINPSNMGVSLRSQSEDVNVAEIAPYIFGNGGGHPQASGAGISDFSVISNLVENDNLVF